MLAEDLAGVVADDGDGGVVDEGEDAFAAVSVADAEVVHAGGAARIIFPSVPARSAGAERIANSRRVPAFVCARTAGRLGRLGWLVGACGSRADAPEPENGDS